MTRSLVGRLLLSYVTVVLVSLVAVGGVSAFLLQDYFYRAREQELMAKGQRIAHVLGDFLAAEMPAPAIRHLSQLLDSLVDARVLIADPFGTILAASAPMAHWQGGRLLRAEVEAAQSGVPQVVRDAHMGQAMFSVIIPIRSGDPLQGILVLHAPVAGTAATVLRVLGLVLMSAALSGFVTLLVGYGISRWVSRPLREMNQIALAMARGDFSARLAVRSEDEVGQLARSINHLAGELNRSLGALAEEKSKLQSVLSGMAEGVLATDATDALLLVNPAAEQFLGVSAKVVLNQSLADASLPPAVVSAFREVLHLRTPHTAEVAALGRTLLLRIAPITPEGRQPIGAVAVLLDISERRQLEQMREQFIENVSHELRTPLTLIQGYLEGMVDGVIKEGALGQHLRLALAEARRLGQLVADLLDFSALKRMHEIVAVEPVSVAEVVNRVVAKLRPLVEEAGLVLEARSGPDMQVRVHPDRLEQVLVNLIQNAIRFTPRGGRINIAAAPAGEVVRIWVQDTGVGIPREEQDAIWDRFHKVDRARTRRGSPDLGGGTGLGLAIVKEIVELFGGRVGVQSEPGQGATFWFTLPAA